METFRKYLKWMQSWLFQKNIGSRVRYRLASRNKVNEWAQQGIVRGKSRDQDNARMYLVEWNDGFQEWLWWDEIK